jgi:hypothetical protein
MDYATHLSEHRRLTILKLLHKANSRVNDSVLMSLINGLGVPTERANVRDDMRFLEKLLLITIKEENELLLGMISTRGRKVVLGDLVVDGVQQPGQV